MPIFEVEWGKRYYTYGTVKIKADTAEEAEQQALDNIGDYTGSMHCDDDGDYVECIRKISDDT